MPDTRDTYSQYIDAQLNDGVGKTTALVSAIFCRLRRQKIAETNLFQQ